MATTGDKSTRNIPEYRQIKPHTHMCTYMCTYAFARGHTDRQLRAQKVFPSADLCRRRRRLQRRESALPPGNLRPFPSARYHPATAFSRSFSSLPPILLPGSRRSPALSFAMRIVFSPFLIFISFFSLSFCLSLLSPLLSRPSLVLANPSIVYRYSFLYALSVSHRASLFVSFRSCKYLPTPDECDENMVRNLYTQCPTRYSAMRAILTFSIFDKRTLF